MKPEEVKIEAYNGLVQELDERIRTLRASLSDAQALAQRLPAEERLHADLRALVIQERLKAHIELQELCLGKAKQIEVPT